MWDQGWQTAPDLDRTAHLLHTAPGDSGQGVGHQAGAQAPEQPYLPIHLDNVLGCKKAKGVASRPAQDTTAGPHTQMNGFPITAKRSQGVCPGSDTSQLRPQVSPDLSLLVKRSTVLLTNKPI